MDSIPASWLNLEAHQECVSPSERRVFTVAMGTAFVERLASLGASVAEGRAHAAETVAVDAAVARCVGSALTVAVCGGSGLGKSALVAAAFSVHRDDSVACHLDVGAGVPVTSRALAVADPAAFVRLVDTVGFTRRVGDQLDEETLDAHSLLAVLRASADPARAHQIIHIDMIWYLVDRIHPEDAFMLKELVHMDIPTVVIIAKADSKDPEAIDEIRLQVHALLDNSAKQKAKLLKEKEVETHQSTNHNDTQDAMGSEGVETIIQDTSPVKAVEELIASLELDASIRNWDIVELRNPPHVGPLCEECGCESIVGTLSNGKRNAWYCKNSGCEFGTDGAYLRLEDTKSLDDSLKMLSASVNSLMMNIPARRFQLAQLLDINPKKRMAAHIVTAATVAALGIGAAPIPFADTPLLLATQYTMILSICRVFGVSALGLNDVRFYVSILAASPFPFLGIFAAGAAKTLPGVGSIGAAVVEAPIAGGLTMAMGIAVIQTCAELHKSRAQGKVAEFRFDKNVQKLVRDVSKNTVTWAKNAFVGGRLSERAVGDHILSVVDAGEAPALLFEESGIDWNTSESQTPQVDIKQVQEAVEKRLMSKKEVSQVFRASSSLSTGS
ncbi:hypothetical protein BC830DRAFT_1167678 [Chytriomyces sp. MP71]|nr:hypothetical protein BC830DRAFT_1167678 [Chytriomyces sp. MP71]